LQKIVASDIDTGHVPYTRVNTLSEIRTQIRTYRLWKMGEIGLAKPTRPSGGSQRRLTLVRAIIGLYKCMSMRTAQLLAHVRPVHIV
jgi:hypothetical protein